MILQQDLALRLFAAMIIEKMNYRCALLLDVAGLNVIDNLVEQKFRDVCNELTSWDYFAADRPCTKQCSRQDIDDHLAYIISVYSVSCIVSISLKTS